MIKICHVSTQHKYTDIRILNKECCSLVNNGFDVTLLTFSENKKRLIHKSVKIVCLKNYNSNNLIFRIIKTIRSFIYILNHNYDIIHIHDPELLLIALFLKLKKKKVIFDSHEFYSLQILEKNYLPKFFRIIISKIYYYIETFVCKRIDAVVQVCTLNGVDYFKNRCKKSIYLNNSPIIYNFQYENDTNKEFVTYSGLLTYYRGITHFVKASPYIKAQVVLIGKIDETYLNELKSMREFKYVKYLGFVEQDEVKEILKKSYVGISTLLDYGQYFDIDTLPTKVYEYMLNGIPVILSNSSYNIKFNNEFNIGLCVNPEDYLSIANNINNLLNNTTEANTLGLNGFTAIQNYFNWAIEEKKMLELYNFIINE